MFILFTHTIGILFFIMFGKSLNTESSLTYNFIWISIILPHEEENMVNI
jgi:predicted permease